MAWVYVGLGSNLGDRVQYLHQALEELKNLRHTIVKNCSHVYETEPVGVKEQPPFLNMVVELNSSMIPRELFWELKKIEQLLGRIKTERWGPREIDLDLLYYGNEVINESDLRLPHPEIANRRFDLVPMKEIAAEFLDPLHKRTITELLRYCPDMSTVRKSSQHVPLQAKE